MVAAAVIGGAVIGAGASMASGSKAASAQKDAAAMSTNEQQREFDATQANLKPFRDAGLSVLPELQSGLAPGGEFNRNFTMADFQKDPGYQFRMDQGQQALERSAAAGGGLLSGGTGKALAQYGQDYASGEYSNAYNRFNNDQTTRFNRLSALAGTGQTATNTLGTLGAQTASNIGENYLQAGNAKAAGYVNQGNAVNNGVSSLGNFYLQQQYLNRIPQSTSTTPGIYSGSGVSSGGYAVA
jgi:hypothetical protein